MDIFVKPSKSWLVLKDPTKLEEVKELFKDAPINITVEGKRHLGAVIGTSQFREEYMADKVGKWCTEINNLTEVAKSQPHAAYAAYIHGEQHKFTYFLRTIADISDSLKPLDDAINNKMIPALFGREITENERELISMPIREGGLGLKHISSNADVSYQSSTRITNPLIQCIITQSDNLPNPEQVIQARTTTISQVKEMEKDQSSNIKSSQSPELKRALEHYTEPGASSWLGALPIAAQGFDLTKGEFQDSLCPRYRLQIKNLPEKCVCNKKFDVTHALNCKYGGFVTQRHDNLRDMEAKLLKVVCRDVETEPQLQKVENKQTYRASANTDDNARLDVRARGFWRQGQSAFFDVRVTNIDSESKKNKTIKAILRENEMEKKREYNRRIMEVEHGSLTPLVFTTYGVMSHECTKFHKSLAEKLCEKKDERYDVIMRYLRVKISFQSLKATLLCLRGSRKINRNIVEHGEDFGFTLDELGL